MSSFSLSATILLLLAGLAPVTLSSTGEAAPVSPQIEQEALLQDAVAQVETLEKLVSQVRNPALSKPMELAVRDLRAALEALSRLAQPGLISIPIQRDPVAFQAPVVDVQIGVAGPSKSPIVVGVKVPIETLSAEEVLAGHELSNADVQSLLDAMAEEGFPDSRLALLRSASMNVQITVEQALSLIGGFDFGTDKVEAAALLHSRISDPEYFYKVYGALDFESDKDALRRRLE